ncbi:MAG: Periplasmic thiol:disulfide interchange protein DsbA [Phycisphaerales bacterium]|jgi:protein-disulfide isomerase|nr:Periplasmic thiol:disulfide interchange protein DsbA [Phycisphaerales bacterium]MDB5354206.1 Periplasmic thiol:disulfide interchange protein DsbA [Phycisphaerales bacterium]
MSIHSPRLTLPVGERDHALGPAEAPATLVEYGDYECPHCGLAHGVVQSVRQKLGDRLRFIFRNFPLSTSHPHAMHAAEAAEAAGAQGKFWEMHDKLFENQQHLKDADLLRYAQDVGLDVGRFTQDMQSHAFADRVQEDFRSGMRSGVNGTPTFFINDARYNGGNQLDPLVDSLQRVAS